MADEDPLEQSESHLDDSQDDEALSETRAINAVVGEQEGSDEQMKKDDEIKEDEIEDAETLEEQENSTFPTVSDHGNDPDEETVETQPLSSVQHEDIVKPHEPYSMPNQLTVTVNVDGEMRSIVVHVEKASRQKPFIGGYRHKVTGVEYHHAGTMTMSKRQPDNGILKFQRETQTVNTRNKVQQTTSVSSTQMTKTGCFVSSNEDKIIIPGMYETADEFHAKRLKAVIVLQSHYRRWHAERLVNGMKQDRCKRLQWEEQERLRRELEKKESLRRDFERRMNPRTKEDFDVLYHALEMWRQDELSRINATLSGAERKAALCQLLEQEAELIASIGRHKIVADKERKELQIKKFLDTAASPRKWIAFDGKMTEMATPYTLRANELRELYNSLSMRYLTQEERMDVLLTLKVTVQEHDSKLTREIIELIERETDLLLRGTKQKSLEGLRKRISSLFLQYVKTPLFNPEVAHLLKVPQQPTQLVHDVYYCRSTGQYLPSSDFELSSEARKMGRSRRAGHIDNVARKRQDDSVYRKMLKQIRTSEDKYGDNSQVAFLLQVINFLKQSSLIN
jgi:hypothetical protein